MAGVQRACVSGCAPLLQAIGATGASAGMTQTMQATPMRAARYQKVPVRIGGSASGHAPASDVPPKRCQQPRAYMQNVCLLPLRRAPEHRVQLRAHGAARRPFHLHPLHHRFPLLQRAQRYVRGANHEVAVWATLQQLDLQRLRSRAIHLWVGRDSMLRKGNNASCCACPTGPRQLERSRGSRHSRRRRAAGAGGVGRRTMVSGACNQMCQ